MYKFNVKLIHKTGGVHIVQVNMVNEKDESLQNVFSGLTILCFILFQVGKRRNYMFYQFYQDIFQHLFVYLLILRSVITFDVLVILILLSLSRWLKPHSNRHFPNECWNFARCYNDIYSSCLLVKFVVLDSTFVIPCSVPSPGFCIFSDVSSTYIFCCSS